MPKGAKVNGIIKNDPKTIVHPYEIHHISSTPTTSKDSKFAASVDYMCFLGDDAKLSG